MRDRHRKASVFVSLSVAAAATLSPSVTLGCGYHDDMSVARGLLNWIYPDALHVVGAMADAVAEQRLPAPNFDVAAPDLFGSRYRDTAQSLQQVGMMLSAASDETLAPSFSLVLVEPVMWTRFEASQSGLLTHVHVTGPIPGDLVLVSGEAVVGEIADGRLTIEEARERGFIRLYGSEGQKAEFMHAYRAVGREPASDLSRGQARSTSAIESPEEAMSLMKPAREAIVGGRADRPLASEVGSQICHPGHL